MSIGLPMLTESDMTYLYKWRVVPRDLKDVRRNELMQLFTLPVESRRLNTIPLRVLQPSHLL